MRTRGTGGGVGVALAARAGALAAVVVDDPLPQPAAAMETAATPRPHLMRFRLLPIETPYRNTLPIRIQARSPSSG